MMILVEIMKKTVGAPSQKDVKIRDFQDKMVAPINASPPTNLQRSHPGKKWMMIQRGRRTE